jgi:hypothetical protein
MTELVVHEIQALEVDSLVRTEGRDVPRPADIAGGKLQAPKVDGA